MSQPQPDAPLDLAAIQARADAATPGPWHVENDQQDLNRWVSDRTGYLEINFGYLGNGTQPDATFVAAARADVPALLARVRELEDALTTERAVVLSNQRAAKLLAEDVQRLEADLRRERAAHSSTIDERDRATDCADRLAAVVAPIDVRGEHSIGNCPWEAALHYAAEQQPAT